MTTVQQQVISDGSLPIAAKRRRQPRLANIVDFPTLHGGQSALKSGRADVRPGSDAGLEIRYLKAAIRQPKRRISAPAAGAPLSTGKSCSVCRCYWWGKIHGER